MAVFSTLRQQFRATANLLQRKQVFGSFSTRKMGDHGAHRMEIKPDDWTFLKTMDLFHMYFCLSFIIYGSIIFYANVFVGPAVLTEIPEGYKPKHWEYFKHPISRFIQRYCFSDPQKEYEKTLHFIFKEDWRMKLRGLDRKIKQTMKVKQDYKAYYYRPISANAWRSEEFEERNRDVFMAENPFLSYFPGDFKDDGDLPPPTGPLV